MKEHYLVINPSALDAYLAKKGLAPRVTDAQWTSLFERISALFGRDLWFRCRLIHQAEDVFRRYCSVFPDQVPQPYRFLLYFEFNPIPSPQLSELQQWLDKHGITWRECSQIEIDTEQEQTVGFRIYGYDPDCSAW